VIMHKAKILLVEDDKNLGTVIRDCLEMSGYQVTLKENGQDGQKEFLNGGYDIILLDVMLPLIDGFTVAKNIRSKDEEIPIIFITARAMKEDRLEGFRIGADDYIIKPFSTEELDYRINAILKRVKSQKKNAERFMNYQIGSYHFDPHNHVLFSEKTKHQLTKREAELLHLLCQNMNHLLRRDVALRSIWGANNYFMGRSMDVYITKLRKLLSSDSNISIINIHNTGFKLEIKSNT
jgi:two-component system, OmpR family, response regulator